MTKIATLYITQAPEGVIIEAVPSSLQELSLEELMALEDYVGQCLGRKANEDRGG